MQRPWQASADAGSDRLRLVVLASGSGTLLQALLDAAEDPGYPARVIAAGADRHDTRALQRATGEGLPAFVVPLADHADRGAWDRALTSAVAAHEPDYVVSAGFMKILGPAFLERFPDRVINTHPALLPAFPGRRAVSEALAAGVKVTGSTVHFADAGVDTGPIIDQAPVALEPGDDEASLHERIKEVERRLLVEVVARLARHCCTVRDRRVSFT